VDRSVEEDASHFVAYRKERKERNAIKEIRREKLRTRGKFGRAEGEEGQGYTSFKSVGGNEKTGRSRDPECASQERNQEMGAYRCEGSG